MMRAPTLPRRRAGTHRFLLALATLIWVAAYYLPRTSLAALLATLLLAIAHEAGPHLRRWWGGA